MPRCPSATVGRGNLKPRSHRRRSTCSQDSLLSRSPLSQANTIFAKTCVAFEAQLIAMDGEDDHVHLLVEYPPKVAVSNLVNSLRGVSRRLLRKERPDIQNRDWKGVLWSPSSFASSCGGALISSVRQYIEPQQTAP